MQGFGVLVKIIKWTADEVVYVSNFVKETYKDLPIKNHVIYNSLDAPFAKQVNLKMTDKGPQNVLMVCSLKAYKGIFEFIQLANDHDQYQFRLVLNARPEEIFSFLNSMKLPSNLSWFSSQQNLHPFYHWADVIVNLSRPDEWIETFGLTIIEGMAYGLPSIVPPIGGIVEVIKEGITGYCVDSRDRQQLNSILKRIMEDRDLYHRMKQKAMKRAIIFDERQMCEKIQNILYQRI